MPPLIDSSRFSPQPWRSVYEFIQPSLESALALDRINGLYERCQGGSPEEFAEKVLQALEISWDGSTGIPDGLQGRQGGLMVVANHPFGGPEALLLFLLLKRLRPDYRILANFILGQVTEIKPRLLLVDPFGGAESFDKNRVSMRQALRWLKEGNLLGIFPAGEVSTWRFDEGRVADKDWNPQVGRLAMASGAAVLPLYFEGGNPFLFHALGLISARLRTALLPRAVFRQRRTELKFRFGAVISSEEIKRLGTPDLVTRALRERTYALQKN